MSSNLSELSGRKGLSHNLFEELGIAAEKKGTVSEKDMHKLAEEYLMGDANIYGTVSFYDFLKPGNQGKKAYICNGSACLLAGTQEKVKKQLKKHFHENEIGEMCCLGRCHENSAFHIAGNNYSAKSPKEIEEIVKKKKPAPDKYHVECSGTVVLTGPAVSNEECAEYLRLMFSKSRDEVLAELKASGVRGRGGAGFPMASKLEFCKREVSEKKFVVCNADEGDPGAYSDRYLMEEQPALLLLGMMMAGYVIGADAGVLYIRGEYPESVRIVQDKIDELRGIGLIGSNILGSGFNFQFKVIKAQGAYICGEETALLSSIEGQRPEVRIRPPYPAQKGLFNKPTVVNNVETLACFPYILKHGGKAYASIGTEKSTGTKLVCLDGFFNRPGMYEVDMGTPLQTVFKDLGQGFREPVKAMHIGGPLGGLVPKSKVKDLTVDFESFSNNGFLLGHASVICIPEEFPVVKYLEHLFEFTAHESCGKCFPCRLGSTRGKELLQKAQDDGLKIDRKLFDDLVETLEIGSLCALGGGLPLPVKNALQYFEKELRPYFK